jgi:hypothetical protein
VAFITPMRTWALISVLARAARLYSRFFPHAPAPPQLANKYDFVCELLTYSLQEMYDRHSE